MQECGERSRASQAASHLHAPHVHLGELRVCVVCRLMLKLEIDAAVSKLLQGLVWGGKGTRMRMRCEAFKRMKERPTHFALTPPSLVHINPRLRLFSSSPRLATYRLSCRSYPPATTRHHHHRLFLFLVPRHPHLCSSPS